MYITIIIKLYTHNTLVDVLFYNSLVTYVLLRCSPSLSVRMLPLLANILEQFLKPLELFLKSLKLFLNIQRSNTPMLPVLFASSLVAWSIYPCCRLNAPSFSL